MGDGRSTHSAIPSGFNWQPTVQEFALSLEYDGISGRIGQAEASRVEGREFNSQSSQTDDLPNLYLSLPSLVLSIIIG